MNYVADLSSRAARDLRALTSATRERVLAAILALEDNPRPRGCLKLTNSEEWRIRVGQYRVRYLIEDAARQITVVRIGHRREIYDR